MIEQVFFYMLENPTIAFYLFCFLWCIIIDYRADRSYKALIAINQEVKLLRKAMEKCIDQRNGEQ